MRGNREEKMGRKEDGEERGRKISRGRDGVRVRVRVRERVRRKGEGVVT